MWCRTSNPHIGERVLTSIELIPPGFQSGDVPEMSSYLTFRGTVSRGGSFASADTSPESRGTTTRMWVLCIAGISRGVDTRTDGGTVAKKFVEEFLRELVETPTNYTRAFEAGQIEVKSLRQKEQKRRSGCGGRGRRWSSSGKSVSKGRRRKQTMRMRRRQWQGTVSVTLKHVA